MKQTKVKRTLKELSKLPANPEPNIPLYDPSDIFDVPLISAKQARGRQWTGFTEIRFTQGVIEADYTMSNGRMKSSGTFVLHVVPGDEAHKLIKAVNEAVAEAFKRFERMKV